MKNYKQQRKKNSSWINNLTTKHGKSTLRRICFWGESKAAKILPSKNEGTCVKGEFIRDVRDIQYKTPKYAFCFFKFRTLKECMAL